MASENHSQPEEFLGAVCRGASHGLRDRPPASGAHHLHVADKPVVSYIEKASELSPEQLQQKLWETLRWPKECEEGLNVEH